MSLRYDLNQISYNYRVELTNRYKGLDLIDRVPEELWTELHDTVQEAVIKTIPKKKKCKKAKWLSEEAFIDVKRREAKSKGEKERYTYLNEEYQRIAKRDKKAFLSDQSKEIEENNRMGKTRDLFKESRDPKGIFHEKMGTMKDRNVMDLIEAEDIKKFSSVQSLSCVHLCATQWTAARQTSLTITNSQSLHKFRSIELVMPSKHFILCCPLVLVPSIFPSIRVFSSGSSLHIRWPNIGASASASVLPTNIWH